MKANGRPIQIDVIDWFNEAGDAITPLVAVAEVKEQPERKAAVALSSPPPSPPPPPPPPPPQPGSEAPPPVSRDPRRV